MDLVQEWVHQQMVACLPDSPLSSTLNIRHSIIPAANGHMTARALVCYYDALATGGIIPPPHSNLYKPPLGSHAHVPKFPSSKIQKKKRGAMVSIKAGFNGTLNGYNNGYSLVDITMDDGGDKPRRMFSNPKIDDAFLGVGDYNSLVMPDGYFGLGFRRFKSDSGEITSFGHSGMGGSTGFCDIEHDFSIAITTNKMSSGEVTKM